MGSLCLYQLGYPRIECGGMESNHHFSAITVTLSLSLSLYYTFKSMQKQKQSP